MLIPKLKEPDHNPNVVINIMAAIGELAQVAQTDMKYCLDELCPIIMDMLQDSSSLAKREVALWTFGQLVENTGYVRGQGVCAWEGCMCVELVESSALHGQCWFTLLEISCKISCQESGKNLARIRQDFERLLHIL